MWVISRTVEDTESAQNFGFMQEPHSTLYPCAWEGEKMPEKVKHALKSHVLNSIETEYQQPDAFIYFTVYGSGASYNWDEDGDFDIQMWVDIERFNALHEDQHDKTQDDLLSDIRRLTQAVNFPSFAELGLTAEDCEGKMIVQYFPKPGTGASSENLAQKPYACYDMEKNDWIVRPKPLKPTFYGDAFLLVQPKCEDIALQAEAAIDELQRNTINWQFWRSMWRRYKNPSYKAQFAEAQSKAEEWKECIGNLFRGVRQDRADAYAPEGKGIEDERDLVQKYLEVWGIFQKLRHFAHEPLPWEERELPLPGVETTPEEQLAESRPEDEESEKRTDNATPSLKEREEADEKEAKNTVSNSFKCHPVDDSFRCHSDSVAGWSRPVNSLAKDDVKDAAGSQDKNQPDHKSPLENLIVPIIRPVATKQVRQEQNDHKNRDQDKGNEENPHGRSLSGWRRSVKAALKGLPQSAMGPHSEIQDMAHTYMAKQKFPYRPPTDYTRVDPEHARSIAEEYDKMQHSPQDPEVLASYLALIKETKDQYDHIIQHGYTMEFYPVGQDPYPAGPRQALQDLHDNKHLYVYPTSAGFGMNDTGDHPLLEDSGIRWNGQPVTYNDLFRGVHDFFGHAKEGVGFRADGEENAWRQHSAMYSALARPAMTAETRGQNSWVNFGPYGEQNQTANQQNTIYADQKAGLLPEWVTNEGVKTGAVSNYYRLPVLWGDDEVTVGGAQDDHLNVFHRFSLDEVGLPFEAWHQADVNVETDGNGNILDMKVLGLPQRLHVEAQQQAQEQMKEWFIEQDDDGMPRPGEHGWTSSINKFADWNEVMQNAQELYNAGAANVLNKMMDPETGQLHVIGEVDSQSNPGETYETEIWQDDPDSQAISLWSCDCEWGQKSWGRTRQWKKYEGRPCKHTLALYWQSLGTPTENQLDYTQGEQTQGVPGQTTLPGMPPAGQTFEQYITQPAPTPGGPSLPTQTPVEQGPAPVMQQPAPPSFSIPKSDKEVGQLELPGTLSSWRRVYGAFQNGDTVRCNVSVQGIDRDGSIRTLPRNSSGEVLWSDEEQTIVAFPLNQSGRLEPHLVRVEAPTEVFYLSPTFNPGIRRRK